MSFLLDTDTVSFALRGEGHVAEGIRARKPSELAVSAVTVAELWYGVEKRRSKRLRKLVESLLASLRIIPFDAVDAARYGEVAARLTERGESIGFVDAMLAAHALARGLTLVTHNEAHFRRVRGLHVEDWYGRS